MKKLIMLSSIFLFLSTILSAQNATEIINKAENRVRGKSTISNITITLVRPNWTREMSIKSWSKGDDYFLILVTAPARDKGNVTLKRMKEVWNWMPSIDRNIKLPPSMMMQSWMGTDFTNDDLVKQTSLTDDYNQKILSEEVLDNRKCWKIELIPKAGAAVVWGKIYMWIDQKDYIQMKAEYYDDDDELINIMKASDIKMLGGKLLPATMEMIPVNKKGQKTILHYNSLEFDKAIEDNFFSVQNMTKVR